MTTKQSKATTVYGNSSKELDMQLNTKLKELEENGAEIITISTAVTAGRIQMLYGTILYKI